jgi:phosphoenolpyruvate carboxykinase (GTP)
VDGLNLGADALRGLLQVEVEVWREEAASIGEHYKKFADRLPKALSEEHASLLARLDAAQR